MPVDVNFHILQAVSQETKDKIRELCRIIDTLTNRIAVLTQWQEDAKEEIVALSATIQNYETYGQPNAPEM